MTTAVQSRAPPSDATRNDALALSISDQVAQITETEDGVIVARDSLSTSSLVQNQEQADWLKHFSTAQQTINAANTAQSAGFAVARGATAASLSIARFFTKHVLGIPSLAIDAWAGNGSDSPGLRSVTDASVDGLFDLVDTLALGGIQVGSAVTAASLSAASTGMAGLHSSLDSDVARSLATFGRLVNREWNRASDDLPPGGLPASDRLTIAKALLAWVSIQTMTSERYEADMMRHLTLAATHEPQHAESADQQTLALDSLTSKDRVESLIQHSRLVLAIYGGAIMSFLNSVPDSVFHHHHGESSSSGQRPVGPGQRYTEEDDSSVISVDLDSPNTLARIRNAVEDGDSPANESGTVPSSFSYVDLLTGKYDDYLLHDAAGVDQSAAERGSYDEYTPDPRGRPTIPNTSRPTYYVVTSHKAKKIIVVMRGTTTLGDVATDLTCESQSIDGIIDDCPPGSLVHSGMLVTALAIGTKGRAVHRAVARATARHSDYDVDLVGHSLGAGVVSLLALIWASPVTGRTRAESGLGDRRLHSYCYAVPCVMDEQLGRYCNKLVTSFVSSWDLVSRLSLGSITDIRNVIAWLCHWEESDPDFSCASFVRSTLEYQSGRMDTSVSQKQRFADDAENLRLKLKPYLTGVHLYPPGSIFLSFNQRHLHTTCASDPMLFEVTGDRRVVFDQIIFGSGMLHGHLPHVYVDILSQLQALSK